MKTKVLIAGAGVAALIAGIALAQAGGHGERMFQRADIDGDGRITEAESETLRKTRFRMLDANADGAVTMQEIREQRQRMRDGHMKDRFGKLDANGNGTVEKSEYDAMADRRFERMDADKDGVLTLDEIRDHRHMHHQRHKDG